VVLALLDGLSTTPLLFLAWMLKVPLLLLLVRWFLHEVGMSAGGLDRPSGMARVLELDREAYVTFRGVLFALLILLGPGAGFWIAGRAGIAVGLLLGGSALLAAYLLGSAVGDPALRRPWSAAEWLVRRPLVLLGGTLGLWAAVLAEWAAARASSLPFLGAALLCLLLRLAMLYLWLLSARLLGVLGR
jgi:hypothetical protein